jgi:hypothetical protein
VLLSESLVRLTDPSLSCKPPSRGRGSAARRLVRQEASVNSNSRLPREEQQSVVPAGKRKGASRDGRAPSCKFGAGRRQTKEGTAAMKNQTIQYFALDVHQCNEFGHGTGRGRVGPHARDRSYGDGTESSAWWPASPYQSAPTSTLSICVSRHFLRGFRLHRHLRGDSVARLYCDESPLAGDCRE